MRAENRRDQNSIQRKGLVDLKRGNLVMTLHTLCLGHFKCNVTFVTKLIAWLQKSFPSNSFSQMGKNDVFFLNVVPNVVPVFRSNRESYRTRGFKHSLTLGPPSWLGVAQNWPFCAKNEHIWH